MENHTQYLKDVDSGWREICRIHSKEIIHLFSSIVESLGQLISGCSLLVVGSFSDGTAKYLFDGNRVKFNSDIDLLLVAPDNRQDILSKRETISSRLGLLSSSVEPTNRKFHIGLRYRFVSELPDFALKCKSLGYDFDQKALTILSNGLTEYGESKVQFDVGCAVENFCSKIWTIIRYVDLDFSQESTEIYSRIVARAKACMDATMLFAGGGPWSGGQNKIHPQNVGIQVLEDQIAEICTVYKDVINHTAKNNLSECVSASSAEEFDFFRLSNDRPEWLARILFGLLELVRCSYLRIDCRPALNTISEYSRLLNLDGGSMSLDFKDLEDAYYPVRYALAEKRMMLSSLFRRDRGPNFLSSLKLGVIGR
jgi:hypothetical protein